MGCQWQKWQAPLHCDAVGLLLHDEGLSDEEANRKIAERYEKRTKIYEVDEGSGGEDYWTPTSADAIKPLYQLIALSRMCPDGVWDEE